MSSPIALGYADSVTLAAGQLLRVTGGGFITHGSPTRQSLFRGSAVFGPFDVEQVIFITASQSPVSYGTYSAEGTWLGSFSSLTELQGAFPSPAIGDYATLIDGSDVPTIYRFGTSGWVASAGGGGGGGDVSSVNGKTGAVVLNKADVGLGNASNLAPADYPVSDAQADAIATAAASGPVSSVAGKTGAVSLAKGDVGLGNVDNTSDATKNAASVTLTNKSISGSANTLSNIPQSAVTNLTTDLAARVPIPYTGVLPSSASGISNLTLANTSVIRQARSGGKRVIMAIVGDSMGAGYLTGGSGLINARPNALAAKVAAMLTAKGIPATNNWAGGWPSLTAASPSDVAAYDPRLSFTGGAVVGFTSMGGYMTQMSAGTDRIFYQPGISGDTVDYYSVRGADGTSSHTLSLDGGTTTFQTITDTGTVGIARYSFSVPAGTLATRLTIKNGAAAAYPLMYQIRNSATPTIEVMNLGSVGAMLQQHAAAYGTGSTDPTSWNIKRAMETILADSTALKIFIVQGGFNDFQAGRTTTQVQADLTTIVGVAKGGGADVIFLDYAAADPTAGSPAASGYAAYRTAISSTCASLGVVYVDTSARLNSYSDSNTRNLMGDQLHLNSAGMAYPAAMIVEAMTAPILN